TSILTVVVAPEDYRAQVNAALKEFAKTATVRGFRKGMIPMSMVRKMIGKRLLLEELNQLITKSLQEYVQTERLPLVGEPLPLAKDITLELDVEKEIPYEFSYEVGLVAPFEINYAVAGEHVLHKVLADEAAIDQEIEQMRFQYGTMTNPDSSEPGDTLFGKIVEVDGQGHDVEGGLQRLFPLQPEKVLSEALKAEMGDGKKAEDRIPLTMADLFTEDSQIANLWETNVSGEQVRDLSEEELAAIKAKSFVFIVMKINRIEKPALDQEFFDTVYGPDQVGSLSDFRDRVAHDIENQLRMEAIKLHRAKVTDEMIRGTEIELSHDFLRRYLLATREQLNEQNIDQNFDLILRAFKWSLILEKMQAENEAVPVKREHLENRARAIMRAQFGGIIGDDESKLDSFVKYFLEDEKRAERLFDEELEDHVFQHIYTLYPVREEEVTGSEFIEIVKKLNADKR
ncbi:MAG: hypothetical protein RLZZ165_1887, partial [Bacteroidota bacterium]